MIDLDEKDKEILNEIQMGFPLDIHPYRILSQRLGIPESELLDRLKRLNAEGALRRIGPVINTRRVGGSSTLVAISVPEDLLDEVASLVNSYPEVSHNYLRPFEYNLWFTVSAKDKETLAEILEDIRSKTGLPMLDLPTKRLFKIGVMFNVR
ncbi:siroheme decarboxylase subunit alpha [Methanohalophilus sp.]|uniref:siroheme decarboxylase subunit alpha n=1 Tax=Methanohalophilus sp. TaxID=1966352 RepID=UPI0026236253|nr:siroheme decarboxylase subunit alpha [Methanohalophilus sp.]MDK2892723.1 siroheme decarboxylase [Methanohalophilus sp.]